MDDLLTRLTEVKSSGDGWMARCPAHEDHDPSLSIGRGDDGRWLLKCHAGCTIDAILLALDLQRRDLLPDTGDGSAGRREVAVYDYVTFEVVRYEPKSFLQRRPDGHGGYLWNTKGVAPRLYRQGDLRGRESVIVAEGEKDVDRLWELGLPATCNAGGAGKWKSAHTDQLVVAGIQRVVVLPDADEAGLAHGRAVTQACAGSNIAVNVVKLPDGSKDVSAYLDAGQQQGRADRAIGGGPALYPSSGSAAGLASPQQRGRNSGRRAARGRAWRGLAGTGDPPARP